MSEKSYEQRVSEARALMEKYEEEGKWADSADLGHKTLRYIKKQHAKEFKDKVNALEEKASQDRLKRFGGGVDPKYKTKSKARNLAIQILKAPINFAKHIKDVQEGEK